MRSTQEMRAESLFRVQICAQPPFLHGPKPRWAPALAWHLCCPQGGKNNQNFIRLEEFSALVYVASKLKEQSYVGPVAASMSQEARDFMRNRELRAAFHAFAAYGSGGLPYPR